MKKLLILFSIVLIAFSLFFSGCDGCKKQPVTPQKPKPPEPDIVAKIGSEYIREGDIDKLASPYIPINITPEAMEQINIKKNEVLDEYVFVKLLRQKAEQHSITVEKSDLDMQFNLFAKKYSRTNQFQKDLKKWNLSPDEFNEKYMKEWAMSEKYLQEQYSQNINVTPEDAKAEYEKNPEKYKIPTNIKYQQILIMVPPKADDKVKQEKKDLAEKIHKMAKDGEPFEKLVEEYSEDQQYKAQQGILTGVTRDALVLFFTEQETIDKIFAMQPKEISDVLEGRMGFYIIKMLSKGEEKVLPFEKVEQIVIELLKKDKQEEIRKNLRVTLEKETEVIIYKDFRL
ncbi:MAG: peptidyl-prolyl cis-trans isomerase [bacterium]|nr:peptidyl-prolyl cis-trans isomerase [bacterium]